MTKKWAEDLNRHSQKNTNRSSNKYVERSSTLLVIVVQLCLTLCNPMDCSMPGPPCSSPSPGTCSNSCPLSQWCHPTILSSVVPFSCLLSFPASGSFPVSPFFTSGSQNIGASASASVLLVNIRGLISLRIDWFDLLAVQGILKSPHHSLKASVLWH